MRCLGFEPLPTGIQKPSQIRGVGGKLVAGCFATSLTPTPEAQKSRGTSSNAPLTTPFDPRVRPIKRHSPPPCPSSSPITNGLPGPAGTVAWNLIQVNRRNSCALFRVGLGATTVFQRSNYCTGRPRQGKVKVKG